MTAKERKKEAKFILGTAPPFTVLGKRRRNKLSVLLHGELDSLSVLQEGEYTASP